MSIFVLQGSGSCRRFVSHRARSITAEETYIVRALSHCARREPSKRRHPSPKTAQRHFAKSAFTLLELMIVVIIVGILAALAIPWFTKAVEKARWGEVVQTLGAIRRACELHYAEFGDYPGPAAAAPRPSRVRRLSCPTPTRPSHNNFLSKRPS